MQKCKLTTFKTNAVELESTGHPFFGRIDNFFTPGALWGHKNGVRQKFPPKLMVSVYAPKHQSQRLIVSLYIKYNVLVINQTPKVFEQSKSFKTFVSDRSFF